MSSITVETAATRPAVPPIKGVSARACLAISHAATRLPLVRTLNMNERSLGGRFESREKYEADRNSNVDAYERLFAPFASFEGKDVFDLGCSTGYLLQAFRQRW